MSDPLPFKKPTVKARLAKPDAEGRKAMTGAMLETIVNIDAGPDFVGFAIVGLMADGRRISHWNATRSAQVQLAKQVRREAANIAKVSREER